MVILSSNTDRLRPVELPEVEPRHALHKEEDTLQQQYARPSWRVDAIAPIDVYDVVVNMYCRQY